MLQDSAKTMEPMTLGSAPSSPSSPTTNPNFLPPFLMGETQPSTATPSISPGRNKIAAEGRTPRQGLFNQSVLEMNYTNSPYSPHVPEKQGPPKQGLFDTVESKKLGSPLISKTLPNTSFNDSFSRINSSVNFTTSINDSLRSPINDSDETLWVTIFGFPPSALSVVLAYFSNCGTIIDKKSPTQGNWVHLKFSSFSEVTKALAFNGKQISNGIMIGVVPYSNKEGKENLNTSVYSVTPKARSLRHSTFSVTSPTAMNTSQNVPQKSTGLMTKAMEYVFGW